MDSCIEQHGSNMLKVDLLPHTARDRAGSLVETLAQYVTAAANREKQVLMLQMVEDMLQSSAGSPFVVHTMKFDGKQMVKALWTLNVTTPVGLVSTDKKYGVIILVWPPGQAIEDVQSALTATVGSCARVMKCTVNQGGATVVQVTVKGSQLSDWLEASVRDTMQHLLGR